MNEDRKAVETKDVKICEGDGILPDGTGRRNEAIDLKTLIEDIIFDEKIA